AYHPSPPSFPTRRSSDLKLTGADLRIVDLENVDFHILLRTPGVDADENLLAGIDARLCACRSFLDARLGNAFLDGGGHASERLRSEEHTSELQSRENLVC